jgi:hypothetical protein
VVSVRLIVAAAVFAVSVSVAVSVAVSAEDVSASWT